LILSAVSQGASRNIWIGDLDDDITEQTLFNEFSQFGPIDNIRLIIGKRTAFVHLCSISAAIQAVNYITSNPNWEHIQVYYGKDRCTQSPICSPTDSFGYGLSSICSPTDSFGYGLSSISPIFSSTTSAFLNNDQSPPHIPNRTVYLGGIHADAIAKDLCDVNLTNLKAIRGGILQNIKFMPSKNIAFVMFICPDAAQTFHDRVSTEGLSIKSKRVKIGKILFNN
jgi:RNA recognition motif-containing protein